MAASACANHFEDEAAINRIQARIRSFLIRKRFQEVRRLFDEAFHELEGHSTQNTPATIRWRSQNLCRPSIGPATGKCQNSVKDQKQNKLSVVHKADIVSRKEENEATQAASGETVTAEIMTKESSVFSDSTSESGSKRTGPESLTSNAEYTPDFESYSSTSQESDLNSTKTDQNPSKNGSKNDSLDITIISQLEQHEISESFKSENAEKVDKNCDQLFKEDLVTSVGELEQSMHTESHCGIEGDILNDARPSLTNGDKICPSSTDQNGASVENDIDMNGNTNSDPDSLRPLSQNQTGDNLEINPRAESETDMSKSPGNVTRSPLLVKKISENELDWASSMKQTDKEEESLCLENEGARKYPVSTKTLGDHELSIAADMTSVWSIEESFAELESNDYSTSLEELQKMRGNIALELLWVQQAIGSRKNYLRLKGNVKICGPNLNPENILD